MRRIQHTASMNRRLSWPAGLSCPLPRADAASAAPKRHHHVVAPVRCRHTPHLPHTPYFTQFTTLPLFLTTPPTMTSWT